MASRRFDYATKGTCAVKITFAIADGKITKIAFKGGCRGNTQGVARLAEGCDAREVMKRLRGVRCGDKPTSCPDQLARAINACLKESSRR